MGFYGPIKVKSTVIRVDTPQQKILTETYDFVDFTNGRALAFPEGVMVVVGHVNYEGWGPDYYERTIRVVSTSNFFLEEKDDTIGYYKTLPNSFGDSYSYSVKRDFFANGDLLIEQCLRKEGRWPL